MAPHTGTPGTVTIMVKPLDVQVDDEIQGVWWWSRSTGYEYEDQPHRQMFVTKVIPESPDNPRFVEIQHGEEEHHEGSFFLRPDKEFLVIVEDDD